MLTSPFHFSLDPSPGTTNTKSFSGDCDTLATAILTPSGRYGGRYGHVLNGKFFISPLVLERPIPNGHAPVSLYWNRSIRRARAMGAFLASSSECTQRNSIMPFWKKRSDGSAYLGQGECSASLQPNPQPLESRHQAPRHPRTQTRDQMQRPFLYTTVIMRAKVLSPHGGKLTTEASKEAERLS